MAAVTTTPVCFNLFIAALTEAVDLSDDAPIGFSTVTRNVYEDCDPDYFSGDVLGEYTIITICRRSSGAALMNIECSDMYYENDNEQTLRVIATVVDWTGAERRVINRCTSIPHGDMVARSAHDDISVMALGVWGILRTAGLVEA